MIVRRNLERDLAQLDVSMAATKGLRASIDELKQVSRPRATVLGHSISHFRVHTVITVVTTLPTLLQERAVIEGVRSRLERESLSRARSLATSIEAASQAHEARDSAELAVARLQAGLAAERGVFEAELAVADSNADARMQLAKREVMGMRGQLTMAEEELLQGALSMGRLALAHDADAAKKAHSRVHLYEETFAHLKVECTA